MDQCASCGHASVVGRFCVNCGHPREEWQSGTAERPVVPGLAPPTEVAAAPPPVFDAPPGARYPMYADEPATARQPAAPAAWEIAEPAGGRTGRPVLPWVLVGIALLLVAATGVFLLVGGGDDDGDTAADLPNTAGSTAPSEPARGNPSTEGSGPPSSEPTTETTAPSGEGDELARTATPIAPATAPPSTTVDGNQVRYVATNMLDGQADTAWRAPGDLSGSVVAFTLPEEVVLSSVGMINGYAKVDPGYDGYTANRRVLTVEWVFADGTVASQTLGDSREMQSIPVDVVTDSVELRILSVSKPGKGGAGRDFTAISEVSLVGMPA